MIRYHPEALDAAQAENQHLREVLKAMRVLQADLDAAQDEIEKLLSEKEELREQVSVLQNQPPLVRVIDINDDPDCIVTEGSHWHTLGGAS